VDAHYLTFHRPHLNLKAQTEISEFHSVSTWIDKK
jgi:hypothetical protein